MRQVPSCGLPARREIQRSLQKVTEALAREVALPSERQPEWSAFEWLTARAVAAMHGVSPMLWRDARWLGPPSWQLFLTQQRDHTVGRHARILDLAVQIDAGARAAGVAVTGLKGLALHELGLYSAGERPMADIDLLVRPADVAAAAGVLNAVGLTQTGENWKERLFSPVESSLAASLGEHANNDVKVELHHRICERLPRSFTDISALVFPRHPVAGLQGYDSLARLFIHLLLHAAGSMAFQSLRMLQLCDIALLCARMRPCDWDELLALDASEHALWFAFPPLTLASRYCAAAVPPQVLRRLANRCPTLLRRVAATKSLYEVSYSYLWVRAFPGFEWSSSVHELMRYALSRLRPDAAHLDARARTIQTHAWAAHGPWSKLSQRRRIARWLLRRPARSLTMHALAAARGNPQ